MPKSSAALPPPTITSLQNRGNTVSFQLHTFCSVLVQVLPYVDASPLQCIVPRVAEDCQGGNPAVLPLCFVSAADAPMAVP